MVGREGRGKGERNGLTVRQRDRRRESQRESDVKTDRQTGTERQRTKKKWERDDGTMRNNRKDLCHPKLDKRKKKMIDLTV